MDIPDYANVVNAQLVGMLELCATVGIYVVALAWCCVLAAVSKGR